MDKIKFLAVATPNMGKPSQIFVDYDGICLWFMKGEDFPLLCANKERPGRSIDESIMFFNLTKENFPTLSDENVSLLNEDTKAEILSFILKNKDEIYQAVEQSDEILGR